jgi:hypothetical protein
MTDDDDLPILNTIREKLVAGIAGHGGRRWRSQPRATARVGVGLAVAVAAAVVLLARPGASSHQVVVRGPLAAVATNPGDGSSRPSTDLIAPSGDPAAPGSTITTTTPATPSPPPGVAVGSPPGVSVSPPAVTTPSTSATPTVPPPRSGLGTGVVLGMGDNGRSISVEPGTTVSVDLEQSGQLIWPHEATSSDRGVLSPAGASATSTSSHAAFDAVAPGTAQLTSYGVPPCAIQPPPTGAPVACPTIASPWSVTVTVL